MKALSVTQPWASVICSGAKDVENRLWQAAKAPGKILIHATKTKVPSTFERPDDYASTIMNMRLMGQIPEYKDMPYGAIIGYVDCYDIVKDSESFWAQPDCFHWCLRDAYLFDEPIEGVKGVRGHLFDVDIDENNLPPAHKVELRKPERKGTHLVMPASPAVIADIEAGAPEVVYDLLRFNLDLFCTKDLEPLDTKTVDFVCGDKVVSRKVKMIEVGHYRDEDFNVIQYEGFDRMLLNYSFAAIIFE